MYHRWLLVVILGASAAAEPTQDVWVLDDFESCREGFAIAATAQSKPWCRFGDATMNEVAPTSDPGMVIDGRYSARYDMAWPGGFAKTRRVFDEPTDLTGYKEVSLMIRSSKGDTETTVTLDLNDGRSTCVSRVSYQLSSSPTEVRFGLSEDDLEVIDGPATVGQILAHCRAVGLHFQSAGKGYTESVVFDDIQLNQVRTDTAVAEAKLRR